MANDNHARARELGVGGLIALGVIYLVGNLLIEAGVIQSRRVPHEDAIAKTSLAAVAVMSRQIDSLYVWHDRRDSDGVPLWYVPRSMGSLMSDQIEVLRDLVDANRDQTRVLERMDRRDEKRR